MEKILFKTIKDHNLIRQGESVVIGVSGGPDSVCLFHALFEAKEVLGIANIYVVHINHQIRGEDADKDQAFVEELCKERGVDCDCYVKNIQALSKLWKVSEEEAGRKVRYDAFVEVAKKTGAAKIALAHNKEDQVETLLMRLLRGTGLDGLSGIEYMRDGMIIRPLLDVSRAKIEAYCTEKDLNPQIDLTNLKSIYARNQVRLELIPYLEKNYNEKVKDHIQNLSKTAKEDKDFIYQSVHEIFVTKVKIKEGKARIEYQEFSGLHPCIRKRLVLKIFEQIGKRQDISSIQLEELEKLIKEKKTSCDIDFSGNQTVKIRYDQVVFQKKKPLKAMPEKEENPPIFIEDDKEIHVEWAGVTIQTTRLNLLENSEHCQLTINDYMKDAAQNKQSMYFDYHAVKGKLFLRGRREGDLFCPKGFQGTKKLKAFFIDEKIDKDIRNQIPLLCEENQVLWILGLRKSRTWEPQDGCKEILKVEYKFDKDVESK